MANFQAFLANATTQAGKKFDIKIKSEKCIKEEYEIEINIERNKWY